MDGRNKVKTREAVAQRILELCNERNITVNALAYISAVPPSTVKNIIYGASNNPGIVTLKMICDGLDISLSSFFNSELFDNLNQEME